VVLFGVFHGGSNARLEINNFWKEQERQKHDTSQGSVKKKGFSKFQKRKIDK
jgi:hypothetical protein